MESRDSVEALKRQMKSNNSIPRNLMGLVALVAGVTVLADYRPLIAPYVVQAIGDPSTMPISATAIFLDSREAVDEAVTNGLAAGGSEAQAASDYGFMYQRQLTDPDGNVLEFGWMDPVAAEHGPDAVVSQQA